jgi:putative YhdH/YhfP family quinone oxidoreductase
MLPEHFQCFLVEKDSSGRVTSGVTERPTGELPEGDVTLRVLYSSLNYKDALAATGHAGVVKQFPHVAGVDAAGLVVESGVGEIAEGDPVLVTGFAMGAERWGGYAQYVRVPHEWIVPLPGGLSLRESMILGTAGFTAGLCVDSLQRHDVRPESGPVVVSGASGGVGSAAVAILAKLGYHVAAVTGKTSAHDFLRQLGAQEILAREDVDDRGGKPLLSGRWAGAVDTVGGNTLATIIRALRHDGCVAACGLVGGNDLPVSVFPFILRAVTLTGIDAAWCSVALRHQIWQRLAGPWKPDQLRALASFTTLEGLPPRIADILAGRVRGHVVVEIGEAGAGQ